MTVIMPGAGACPHCRTSLSADATVVGGRFSHHPRLGFMVDGVRLEAPRAVHLLLGCVMRAGAVVPDSTVADAIEYDGGRHREQVAVLTTMARRAFRSMGVEPPITRMWGAGLHWTGNDLGLDTQVSEKAICPECGYNLFAETMVEQGPFRHDPKTGIAYVAGVRLKGAPQLHALLGTFLRSGGDVIRDDIIADRIGSESDDPSRMIKTLVCHLRSAIRHHGVDLPLRCIHGVGYRWMGEGERSEPEYFGPPVPARIRQGRSVGPDLSHHLVDPPEGTHSCGCPLSLPRISADGWSWDEACGLQHREAELRTPPASGRMLARVMAASGRYVHALHDLADVIGGDPANAGDHLNVLVCNIRAQTGRHGLVVPISAKHKHGIRWTGSAPVLRHADPTVPCPSCELRAETVVRLTGSNSSPASHPSGLSRKETLVADILSSMPGRIIAPEEMLGLIGSKTNDSKLIQVYLCRIRRAYHDAGLGNPVRNHWGRGYEWLETPEAFDPDNPVGRVPKGTPRKTAAVPVEPADADDPASPIATPSDAVVARCIVDDDPEQIDPDQKSRPGRPPSERRQRPRPTMGTARLVAMLKLANNPRAMRAVRRRRMRDAG